MNKFTANLLILLSVVSISFTQENNISEDGAYMTLDDYKVDYVDIDEKEFIKVDASAVPPTEGIVIEATTVDYLEANQFQPMPIVEFELFEAVEIDIEANWEAELIFGENMENWENSENWENIENSEWEIMETIENFENIEIIENTGNGGAIEITAVIETVENGQSVEASPTVAVNTDPNLVEFPGGLLVINQEEATIIDYHTEEPTREETDEVDDNKQPEAETVDEKGFLGIN